MDLLPNWPSAEQESSQRDKQYVVGKAGCASHLAPGMESLLHPGLIGKGAKLPSCRKGRTGQCLWQCGAVPPGLLRSRLGGPWRPPLTSCPAPACALLLPSSTWKRPPCLQAGGRETLGTDCGPPGKASWKWRLQSSDLRVFHPCFILERTPITPALFEIVCPVLVQREC